MNALNRTVLVKKHEVEFDISKPGSLPAAGTTFLEQLLRQLTSDDRNITLMDLGYRGEKCPLGLRKHFHVATTWLPCDNLLRDTLLDSFTFAHST